MGPVHSTVIYTSLRNHLKKTQEVLVMHPGWCKTDMGGPSAFDAPEKGGARIYDGIWLDKVEPGKFYN